jgi:hypothetical protein
MELYTPDPYEFDSPYDPMMFEIKLDFSTHEYELRHLGYKTAGEYKKPFYPGYDCYNREDDTTFRFQSDSTHLHKVVIWNPEMAPDDVVCLDRFSITDFEAARPLEAEPGTPIQITQPTNLTLCQANQEIKGWLWTADLGFCQLRYLPWELKDDPEYSIDLSLSFYQRMMNLAKWPFAGSVTAVVPEGGTISHWHTELIPNGYYLLAAVVVNDAGGGFSYSLVTRYPDGPYYEPVKVVGNQKANNFRHEEVPDISVPWPGQYPFELRRHYSNREWLTKKPFYRGWQHYYDIKLIESTANWYDGDHDNDWSSTDSWGIPYGDDQLVGFGDIWVTYPDGSRRLFRHDAPEDDLGGPQNPSVYYPVVGTDDTGKEVRDKTGDYVTRESHTSPYSVVSLSYTLHRPDGTKYNFHLWTNEIVLVIIIDPVTGEPIDPHVLTGWTVATAVESIEDMFGNALAITWDDMDFSYSHYDGKVTSIKYEPAGGQSKEIKLTLNDDVYTKAELIVDNDTSNPCRTVVYEVYDDDYTDGEGMFIRRKPTTQPTRRATRRDTSTLLSQMGRRI